mgnify:CR=1 FL=1
MYNLVNKQTGVISSTALQPIDCWQVRDGVAEWVEVEQPQPTVAERVAALYSVYAAARSDLLQQLTDAALVFQDMAYANEIREEIASLDAKYIQDVGGIVNG